MGVRVFEADSASDSDECPLCCGGIDADKPKIQTKSIPKPKFQVPHEKIFKNAAAKDLVGNHKEFRIEDNSRDLRIIGNNNRIRITNNTGRLQIIGNNTRLKIQNNNASIKYTGNDGRIYLGSGSPQQTIEYIGCNGILKVVKSLQHFHDTQSKAKTDGRRATATATSHPRNPTTSTINSHLTIVNNASGNIIIKNAVNVSI